MLVVEYVVESSVLHDTLSAYSDIAVYFEEQYRTRDDVIRLQFWMQHVNTVSFQSTLEGDQTVTNARRLGHVGDRTLFSVDLTSHGRGKSTVSMWSEDDVTLLSAHGRHEGWTKSMRFPDRSTLLRYREAYVDRGCSFFLLSLSHETEAEDGLTGGLTPTQRETLLIAYDSGYFAVPRQISQEELGTRLDISAQSVSERLRRAIQSLIESTLGR